MPFLILALFSSAFLCALLAAQALTQRSRGLLLARRLGHPAPASVAAERRSRLRSGAYAVVVGFGRRLVATRSNLDRLRDDLGQAGYRSPAVLPAWFGVRSLAMIGMAGALFVIGPLAGLSGGAALLLLPYALLPAWLLPRLWLRQRIRSRQTRLRRALPDVLDLLVVCVEAGLGLNQALVRVAQEILPVSAEMSAELRTLNLEIQAGTSRAEAFRNLGHRTGVEDVRALATMLIQADRFGTSIGQALRVQCESLRTRRRQRAEEEAAKTTIKLVFPLVFFIFPALFVVILGPALISVLKVMR